MKDTEHPPRISLEDLLQLKRAERPSADFWPEFERQMRTKQLAAIVETRPSWRDWFFRKSVGIPLGAAAALAMAFGSYRGIITDDVAIEAPHAPVALAGAVVAPSGSQPRVTPSLPVAHETAVVSSTTPAAVATITPRDEHANARSASELAPSSAVSHDAARPPAAELVAHVAHDVSDDLPEPAVGDFAASVELALSALVHVSAATDTRGSRLLAQMVNFDPHAADSSDAVRSRERITRRINEETLYDSITRLGLGADRVSIKF